jgi:hypothetical protein
VTLGSRARSTNNLDVPFSETAHRTRVPNVIPEEPTCAPERHICARVGRRYRTPFLCSGWGPAAASFCAANGRAPPAGTGNLTWNGMSSDRMNVGDGGFSARVGEVRARAVVCVSSRRGLDAKVAAVAAAPRHGGGGGRGWWCRTCRHHADRLAATLTCAGRDRSVFRRRRLPQTVHAGDRPKTAVRRLTRGSVPAKAVADASCDRGAGNSSSRSARRARAVMVVRRSSRPRRTRRVRGQPRSRQRCGGLCGRRGAGTVRTTGPARPKRAQRRREEVLGGGAAVRG